MGPVPCSLYSWTPSANIFPLKFGTFITFKGDERFHSNFGNLIQAASGTDLGSSLGGTTCSGVLQCFFRGLQLLSLGFVETRQKNIAELVTQILG